MARLNLVILNEMFVTLFGPLHMSEVRMNDAQYHYPNVVPEVSAQRLREAEILIVILGKFLLTLC